MDGKKKKPAGNKVRITHKSDFERAHVLPSAYVRAGVFPCRDDPVYCGT